MNWLIVIFIAALHLPDFGTLRDLRWKPQATPQDEIRLTKSIVGLFTHCSHHFDPTDVSGPAVRRVAAKLKQAAVPSLYFHDRNHYGNPHWNYLYNDWHPTAFVTSEIGHFDINLSQVERVVIVGGFGEQCQRATVTDTVRCWYRDGYCHDLTITQVVDGIFTVGAKLPDHEPATSRIRAAHRKRMQQDHRKAVLTMEELLEQFGPEETYPSLLIRHLPRVPSDCNIVMDVFGVICPLQIVDPDAPMLTFAYRRSTDDFLAEPKPQQIDFKSPRWASLPLLPERMLPQRRSGIPRYVNSGSYSTGTVRSSGIISSRIISSEPYPASGTIISSQPGTIINSYPTGTITYPSETIVYPSGGFPTGTLPSMGTPVYPSGSFPTTTFPSTGTPVYSSGSFPSSGSVISGPSYGETVIISP